MSGKFKATVNEDVLRTALILLLSFLLCPIAFGQSPSAKWQVATIMDAKTHPAVAGEGSSPVRYDVTVRVGNTEYVVLYVPPDGTVKEIVEYRLGTDRLVLVGTATMKFNDTMGRTFEVPILRQRTIAAKTTENKPEKKD